MKSSRMTSKLSESVQQQVNRYAVAAIAAGVGVMALAEPSDAEIVYTPVYKVIKGDTTYELDLNHDGITDFTFKNSTDASTFTRINMHVTAPAGNSVAGFKQIVTNSGAYVWCASKFGAGKGIGPRRQFTNPALLFYYGVNYGYRCFFGDIKNRYLGTRFKINGESHYGWVRLSLLHNGNHYRVVLTGYAYETVPQKRIIAGRTHDSDGTKQPASIKGYASPGLTLGLLALGAPGLSIWRREELLASKP
jgi:hypothetical protein